MPLNSRDVFTTLVSFHSFPAEPIVWRDYMKKQPILLPVCKLFRITPVARARLDPPAVSILNWRDSAFNHS